jgi:hypothetical protein
MLKVSRMLLLYGKQLLLHRPIAAAGGWHHLSALSALCSAIRHARMRVAWRKDVGWQSGSATQRCSNCSDTLGEAPACGTW